MSVEGSSNKIRLNSGFSVNDNTSSPTTNQSPRVYATVEEEINDPLFQQSEIGQLFKSCPHCTTCPSNTVIGQIQDFITVAIRMLPIKTAPSLYRDFIDSLKDLDEDNNFSSIDKFLTSFIDLLKTPELHSAIEGKKDILIMSLQRYQKLLAEKRKDLLEVQAYLYDSTIKKPQSNKELQTFNTEAKKKLLSTLECIDASLNSYLREEMLRDDKQEIDLVKEIENILYSNQYLSKTQKRNLLIAYLQIYLELSKNLKKFGHLFKLLDKLVDNYTSKTSLMANLLHFETDTQDVHNLLMQNLKKIIDGSALLIELPLYFYIGDLTAFYAADKGYISPQEYMSKLRSQLDLFKNGRLEPKNLTKTVSFLRQNPRFHQHRERMKQMHQFYSKFSSHLDTALKRPLQGCALTPSPVSEKPRKKKLGSSSSLSSTPPLVVEDKETTVSIDSLNSQQTIEKKTEKVLPPRPVQNLSELETLFKKRLSSPSKVPLKVKTAKTNALDHGGNFLVSLSRFVHLLEKGFITQEQLLQLVSDCVSEASYFNEQLLKALIEQQKAENPQGSETEKFPHRLDILYYNYNWSDRPLPRAIKDALERTSNGVLSVRGLAQLAGQGPTPLAPSSKADTLLAFTYSFCKAETAEKAHLEQILLRTIDYCIDQLLVAHTLQTYLHPVKADAEDPTAQQLKLLKKVLKRRASGVKLIDSQEIQVNMPQRASDALRAIETAMQQLISYYPLGIYEKIHFDNILNNYLPRLRAEFQAHNQLPHKQLKIHYTNIFLLNQYIAETFLYRLLDFKGITYDKKAIDHDLMKQLSLLSYKEGDLPQKIRSFLKRGKETRDVLRYQASAQKNTGTSKLFKQRLQDISKIVDKHSFEETGSADLKGFDVKKGTISAVKEEVLEDLEALQLLVTHLSQHMMPLQQTETGSSLSSGKGKEKIG